jgi:hypothetical protein
MDEEVFYYLTIEDIQSVAAETIDRELTHEEIDMIKDSIAERINWYDAVL